MEDTKTLISKYQDLNERIEKINLDNEELNKKIDMLQVKKQEEMETTNEDIEFNLDMKEVKKEIEQKYSKLISELEEQQNDNKKEKAELEDDKKFFATDKNIKTVTMEIAEIEKEIRKKELEMHKLDIRLREFYMQDKHDNPLEWQEIYNKKDEIRNEITELESKKNEYKEFLDMMKNSLENFTIKDWETRTQRMKLEEELEKEETKDTEEVKDEETKTTEAAKTTEEAKTSEEPVVVEKLKTDKDTEKADRDATVIEEARIAIEKKIAEEQAEIQKTSEVEKSNVVKITRIEIQPISNTISIEFEDKDGNKGVTCEFLKYDSVEQLKAENYINEARKHDKYKDLVPHNTLDANICIALSNLENNLSNDLLDNYIDAIVSGKNLPFELSYDLIDLDKATLTREQRKTINQIAKAAHNAGAERYRDGFFKRAFNNVKSFFGGRKMDLLAEKNNQIRENIFRETSEETLQFEEECRDAEEYEKAQEDEKDNKASFAEKLKINAYKAKSKSQEVVESFEEQLKKSFANKKEDRTSFVEKCEVNVQNAVSASQKAAEDLEKQLIEKYGDNKFFQKASNEESLDK